LKVGAVPVLQARELTVDEVDEIEDVQQVADPLAGAHVAGIG
jgi:hypothetical protein